MDSNYSETVWFNDGSSSLFKRAKFEFSNGDLQLLKSNTVIFSIPASQINVSDIDPRWHSIWSIDINGMTYKISFSWLLINIPVRFLYPNPGLVALRHRDNLYELLKPYNPASLPIPPGQN